MTTSTIEVRKCWDSCHLGKFCSAALMVFTRMHFMRRSLASLTPHSTRYLSFSLILKLDTEILSFTWNSANFRKKSHSPHCSCLYWRQKQGKRTETTSDGTNTGICAGVTQSKSHCRDWCSEALWDKKIDWFWRENFTSMNSTFQGHSAAGAGTRLHAGTYRRKERGKISVT